MTWNWGTGTVAATSPARCRLAAASCSAATCDAREHPLVRARVFLGLTKVSVRRKPRMRGPCAHRHHFGRVTVLQPGWRHVAHAKRRQAAAATSAEVPSGCQ